MTAAPAASAAVRLAGLPSLQDRALETVIRANFWETSALPITGMNSANRRSSDARKPRMSPSPSSCGIAEVMWLPLSQAFVASLGSRSTALRARLRRTGTMISTHEVTRTRARPVSADG
ncbi:MAG: hypothetical protein ACXVH3_11370, partial [Solirubrobacteraceae bacterium]